MEFREEFQELTRQGRTMAALIKRWQQCRRRALAGSEAVDLNQVIRDIVELLGHESRRPYARLGIQVVVGTVDAAARGTGRVPLALDLAADLPPLLGDRFDLRRLCHFLIGNALLAAAAVEGEVVVRTVATTDGLRLSVEDTGPSVAPEQTTQFLEPAGPAREGTNPLELAACCSIVRRLQGRLHADSGSVGGVAILVDLPLSSERA